MRDDSSLYSGISSASIVEQREQRKAQHEEKREKQIALAPSEEIIADQFKKEVTAIMYAPYLDEDNMSDEQFRTERRARRLTVTSLLAIQARMNNILRTNGRDKPAGV